MLLSLAPAGTEFRVNNFTTSDQSTPAVAADAEGNFVVVWESFAQDGSGRGIYAQRYNAAGLKRGSEFRVNSFTTGDQRFPAVAMDANGSFVVAWDSVGQDGSLTGIYAERFSAAGAPGLEFRVNTFTTGEQLFPGVAMSAGGSFVVTWQGNGSADSYGVYAQRYNAAGGTQGGNFLVNTVTNDKQQDGRVAMDADGDFVITWTSRYQDGSSNGIYAQRYDELGVAQGGEFRVNTITTGRQSAPSVAMDASGDFLVAWTGVYDIFAQRYNAAGVAQGGEFRANTVATGLQQGAAVAMDADGNFLIAWGDSPAFTAPGEVLARSYNAAGVARGDVFLVNSFTTGIQDIPRIAMNAFGDAVIAWRSFDQDGSGQGVYAQRYRQQPTPAGPEFRVNTFTTDRQTDPAVAVDADGDAVVVWHSLGQDGSNYGIYAQRYDAAGVAQGGEFLVNTFTVDRQFSADVAMDADGDFVVAWDSYQQDGSFSGIYAQRFNALGVRQGSEFRVNTTTANNQREAATAMDADGDFVIVWSGNGNGDVAGVFARRFSAAGVPQGAEFRVTNFMTPTQSDPSVAMDADGDFVVTWTSALQDLSDDGVYAQRYNAAGVPLGGEFRVNSDNFASQHSSSVAMDADGAFVVAWQETQLFDNRLEFRRYDNQGIEQSTDVPVTDTGFAPSVAMSPTGNFVVTWTADQIFGKGYSATGLPTSSEFRINTITANVNVGSPVAMEDNGDFVVAWSSNGQDGSFHGVYAQRYVEPILEAPAVGGSGFLYVTSPQRLSFTFDQNVSASLGTDDIVVENLTTSQTIPSTDFSLSYDLPTNTATFSYTGNAGGFSSVLPDGNYRATLLAAGITNAQGAPLPENHVFTFFFLNGDANRDARVNLNDFNVLAANFGQSGRDFTQGDFTYDAIVNLADFNVLAARFGQVLPAGAVGSNSIRGKSGGVDDLRKLLEELT